MSTDQTDGTAYRNPVYPASFPDPFVLKHCGEYWAYCTGFWRDGRCFGVLRSSDLVHWEERPGAMAPLPGGWTEYWAPEVAYWCGSFYLYYSAGNEERMQIRVAVSGHPGGPFADSGRRLTTQDFAIDAHVFVDEGGDRYLFYATDFLDEPRVGTGTVCDRLLDAYTLAGHPQAVTRACFDWQIYDPHRVEKGGACWHTVEGPFVLRRKGRYYQMFSGGNWKNRSYGVSYAVADRLDGLGEWVQAADGERVLPILRTVLGEAVGPGHNSVVRGPDNQQLFCVYHRWERNERVMAIDRLEWVGERLMVLGPTSSWQPTPIAPGKSGFSLDDQPCGPGRGWRWCSGRWSIQREAALQESVTTIGEARYAIATPAFVSELSSRAVGKWGTGSRYGVGLNAADRAVLRFWVQPDDKVICVCWQSETGWHTERHELPEGFEPEAYTPARLVVDGSRASIALGGTGVAWQGRLGVPPEELTLQSERAAAEFAGFRLTVGWEDLFEPPHRDPAELGWHGSGAWLIEDRRLWHRGYNGQATITKGPPLKEYELVVNARLADTRAGGSYGFYPALLPRAGGPLVTVERTSNWAMVAHGPEGEQVFPLPAAFDPTVDQQFRFRKAGGCLIAQWEGQPIGVMGAPRSSTRIGLYVHRAPAAFDMVRVTAL